MNKIIKIVVPSFLAVLLLVTSVLYFGLFQLWYPNPIKLPSGYAKTKQQYLKDIDTLNVTYYNQESERYIFLVETKRGLEESINREKFNVQEINNNKGKFTLLEHKTNKTRWIVFRKMFITYKISAADKQDYLSADELISLIK